MPEIVLLSDLTPAELREAALVARAGLVLDAAVRNGVLAEPLIDVDVERFEEILAFAADQGIELPDDEVDWTVIELIGKAAACA